MSACAICLDTLKSPVALPCGHVYCHGCVSEAIKTTAGPSSPVAYCPTCRERVFIVTPNPLLIPPHLRPFLLSPFRRLYLDTPTSSPSPPAGDLSSATSRTSSEDAEKVAARLQMENAVLRQSCHAWRARANAHVAAQLGLGALVRLERHQTRTLREERDELARKYEALKRKFSDVDREAEPEPGLGDVTWPESLPHEREHDQTEIPAQTDDVPCVPLICPDEEDVSAVSDPRPERTSKRRRISPASLRLEHPPKSAVSIPAMVIPHLVSHGPMASTSAILSNN